MRAGSVAGQRAAPAGRAALWFACVALTVAGCGTRPTESSRSPPEQVAVPIAWQTGLPGDALEPTSAWWRGFGDPALTRWVDLALENNTDLAVAIARVREARAQEEAARSAQWPSLDLALGFNRTRSLNALGRSTETTSTQPVFQAAYELDLFGRVHQQVRAAEAATLAAAHASDVVRLSVAAAMVSAYVTLGTLDARLAILQDTLASREASLRLAERRAQVGYTSALEWRQAQAEYEATAQQLPQAQAAIARQEHALTMLAGLAPGAVNRGVPLAVLKPLPVPMTLPSELLRRRPDIAQAEASLAAADATLAASRAQFMPQVRLSASVGRLFTSSLDEPVDVWSVGASVLAPLFSAGRLQAQFDATDARREQAAWAYRRTVLGALREVEDGLSNVARIREQRIRLQAQRFAVAEALRHATNRYRAGYSSYLEQLDAQRSLLSTELALVQARGDELNALVALHQALGGGWRQAGPAAQRVPPEPPVEPLPVPPPPPPGP